MRSKSIGCYALILLFALIAAAPRAQEAQPATPSRHFLWKIQGQRGAAYLLGSIHLLKPEDYPLAQPIETAFAESDIAVFETDLGQMELPAMEQKLTNEGRLRAGQTLRQVLSPETYSRFHEQVNNIGLPADIFDKTKPAIAAMTLQVIQLHKLGFNPDYGVDRYFYRRARREGKQILGLESADFQFRLVTDFSQSEGEFLMKSTLDNIDDTKAIFADLLKAWQTGDGSKLGKLLYDSMRECPALFKRTVTDRNQNWVSQIQDLLRGDKTAIVIVGAGHLVGDQGVVELLRNRGVSVIQQ